MKKRLRQKNKGFISVYFLAVLLYITSIITVITLKERENIQTIMNINASNEYLKTEISIIHDLKCKLLNHTLLESDEVWIDDIAYTYEVGETTIYVSSEIEEIYVVYDPSTNKVMDYNVYRNQ